MGFTAPLLDPAALLFAELWRYFSPYFDIEDLCGLDNFHSRFASDPRWNSSPLETDGSLAASLQSLEERFSRDPAYLKRAAHYCLSALGRTFCSRHRHA